MLISALQYKKSLPAFNWKPALPALLALLCLPASGRVCRAQSWSPDGSQVVAGGPMLQLLNVETPMNGAPGTQTPITVPNIPNALAPIFSPDGKTLAFLTGSHQLALLNLENQQQTEKENDVVGPAAWSPYSKTYAVVVKDENGALHLHLDYRDGGQLMPPIPLPFQSLSASDRPLAWVPNTDNLVIAGGDNGKIDLYLIDQGQLVRLTSTGDVLGYVVSPDGSHVLWARRSPNTHYILLSLYELKIDSRTTRKLDFPNVVSAVNPHPRRAVDAVQLLVFSPDMTRFAFVTRGGPQSGPGGAALWISDITGKDVRQVGQGKVASTPQPPADATGLTFPTALPAFSPDSKLLAAVRVEGDQRTLLITDVATGQSRSLPLTATSSNAPTPSH